MAMHNPPGQGLHPYLALSRRHPLLLLPRGDVEEDLLEGGLRQRVALEPQLCRRRFERTEDGAELDGNFARAAKNIEGLAVLPSQGANVYDILNHKTLVLTKAGVEALEARLS